MDPEILDPESKPLERQGDDAEAIVQAVQHALPGATLRVDAVTKRIEVEGPGGPLVVERGPLFTATVRFGPARFTFIVAPGDAKTLESISARVREIAADQIVAFEEQVTPHLRRTAIFRAREGRLIGVIDQGVEPHAGDIGNARLASFSGAWNRTPTKDDRARIDRETGGFLGKLKRKLAAAVLERLFPGNAAPSGPVDLDDGPKKLGR